MKKKKSKKKNRKKKSKKKKKRTKKEKNCKPASLKSPGRLAVLQNQEASILLSETALADDK